MKYIKNLIKVGAAVGTSCAIITDPLGVTSVSVEYGKSILNTYGPLMKNNEVKPVINGVGESLRNWLEKKIENQLNNISNSSLPNNSQEMESSASSASSEVMELKDTITEGEKLMIYWAYNSPKPEKEVTDLLSDEVLYNDSSISEVKLKIGDLITKDHINLINKYDPDFLKITNIENEIGKPAKMQINQYLNKKLTYFYASKTIIRDSEIANTPLIEKKRDNKIK